jgi:hypothetical protein
LGTELVELQNGTGVQRKRAVGWHGLGETDCLVGKEDRLGDKMLALVCLGQAVVAVEVLRLGQRQLLEDLFGALELVSLQSFPSLVPSVEVVFFGERADVRELTPHAVEMLFQGGWRGTLVMAGHGGIVPQIGQGVMAGASITSATRW